MKLMLPYEKKLFSAEQNMLIEIQINGGSDFGYTRGLLVKNYTTNKILFKLDATNIIPSVSNVSDNMKVGNLSSMSCKVFLPKNSKIEIEAVWSLVNTKYHDVWLNIKGVSFNSL
jgi:hypothetical protein